jgi:hypothetical protein
MAFERPFEQDGITYPAAYTRITSIIVDATSTGIYACTYADYAARLRDDFPIFAEQHFTETASLQGSIYPACYAYLKTLPGFEHAIDFNPEERSN